MEKILIGEKSIGIIGTGIETNSLVEAMKKVLHTVLEEKDSEKGEGLLVDVKIPTITLKEFKENEKLGILVVSPRNELQTELGILLRNILQATEHQQVAIISSVDDAELGCGFDPNLEFEEMLRGIQAPELHNIDLASFEEEETKKCKHKGNRKRGDIKALNRKYNMKMKGINSKIK